MIYVRRNNQEFGPYDESTLLAYVNSGQILRSDSARSDTTNEENTVKYFLKKAGLKAKVPHKGTLFHQLAMIGSELILPKSTIISKQWLSDKRLLLLAIIGLFPTIFMAIPFPAIGILYAIALYFSCIWGIFFYYFFKTKQVSLKHTLIVFFVTQLRRGEFVAGLIGRRYNINDQIAILANRDNTPERAEELRGFEAYRTECKRLVDELLNR